MRVLVLLFVWGLASIVVTAQPVVTFKKRFGTSGSDEARFVEVLPDNSFIVAGSSTGGGFGGTDAMLVKFNADGTVAWSRAYGGSGNEFFMHILACSDGNYLAIGETTSFGAGNIDFYVVKFDGSGNVVWERTCGGSSQEWSCGGLSEVSDGYIISGATRSFGAGFWDIYAEKLDFNGNTVWTKCWGESAADVAGETLIDGSGNIWVSGGYRSGSQQGLLVQLDANGVLQNGRHFGGSNDEGSEFIASGGAGIIVSGSTWSYSNNNQYQPWIISFNSSGNFVWGKRYVFPAGNHNANVEDCPDGGFIFSPYNIGNDVASAYLVKTDNNGNLSWAKAHAFNGRMYHARPSPDGGYVAVGFTAGDGRDMFILKTDGQGNVEDCCPMDVAVGVFAINPSVTSVSPPSANGQNAAAPAAQDQSVGLAETDICNGPSCCVTDAGSMNNQNLNVCINQTANLVHNGDEMLEPDDLLQFILYTDPSNILGSVIATSNTPVFTFDSTIMQTGVKYYVAAIAGNNVGGNVDLNDPCLDISNAAEFTWRGTPQVQMSIDNSNACPGKCLTVNVVLTGASPFTLTVSNPFGANQTLSFASNTGSFEICVPAGASPGSVDVQALEISDLYCSCP